MIAGKFRDLVHTFVRCSQQMRSPLEPDLLYISGICKSGLVLDYPVKVVLMEMKLPDQLLDGDRSVMSFNII